MGLCKVLEWAKSKGKCPQDQLLKPEKDEVKNPPKTAPALKNPVKQTPMPVERIKPSIKEEQNYKGIMGIALMNGKIIEGQVVSMNTDIIKIRTKDGIVLSYDFKKDVKNLIMENGGENREKSLLNRTPDLFKK
jgi:hypothetical protein